LFYLQQIINGIAQGSIYALTAVGYAIILGIVNIPSFVHGDVMMVGAFVGYYSVLLFPHNILLVFIIVFAANWFLGIIVDMVCYKRFRNSPRQVMLICTVGVSIFLKSFWEIISLL
jgi:branched-chain amino acid transport system permease protein